jgi:hypothetical protein
MTNAACSIGRAHCPAFCRLSIGQKDISKRVKTAHMFKVQLDHPINEECTKLFWDNISSLEGLMLIAEFELKTSRQ